MKVGLYSAVLIGCASAKAIIANLTGRDTGKNGYLKRLNELPLRRAAAAAAEQFALRQARIVTATARPVIMVFVAFALTL